MASSSQAAVPPSSSSSQDETVRFRGTKRALRLTIAGLCFAIPAASCVTLSPLIKLSLTTDNFKKLGGRIMGDYFMVNFLAASFSYWLFIDRKLTHRKALDGYMPYWGPLTAQSSAVSCLVASHFFYPGLWAVINERTWRQRIRECCRLTGKTLVAYAPYHVPAAITFGFVSGVVMFPSKYLKRPPVAAQVQQ